MEKGWIFAVDTREHGSTKALVKRMKIDHKLLALEAGDLAAINQNKRPWEYACGMEKKKLNDLVQSITQPYKGRRQGRLFGQMKKMQRKYDYPLLGICGRKSEVERTFKKLGLRINWNVVEGTLASLVVRSGMTVIWRETERELIDMAYRVCTKVSEGKLGRESRSVPKYDEYNTVAVLMHVPGVTQAIAERLKVKFGSLSNMSELTPSQFTIVDGVGDSTGKALFRLIQGEV